MISTLWLFAFSRETPQSYFEINMTSNDQFTAVDADAFEEFFKLEKRRFLGSDGTNAELFRHFMEYQGVVVEQGNKVLVSICSPLKSNNFLWYVFYL